MDYLINKIIEVDLRSQVAVNIFTLFFAIYLGLSLLRFTWPGHFMVSFIIASIGSGLLLLFSLKINKSEQVIYKYILLLIFSYITSSLFVGRLDRVLQVLVFIFMGSGIALLLSKKIVKPWGGYLVFYLLSGYFLYSIIQGASPDNVIFCSHNGVSLMMLVACISCYILDENKIRLLPALITVIVSFWAIGRSGIIASGLLFSGLALMKYSQEKKIIYFLLGAVTLVTLIIFISAPFFAVDDNALKALLPKDNNIHPAISNYVDKSFDKRPSERLGILYNYYNNLDIKRFFLGVNVSTDPWPDAKLFAYNYHNSFINLHAQTGIVGMLTVILLFGSFVFFAKKNFVYSLIIIVMALRWSTDIGLFFESWDFIPYFFIFIFLKNMKSIRWIKEHSIELKLRE